VVFLSQIEVKSFKEFVDDSNKLLGLPVCEQPIGAQLLWSDNPKDYESYNTTADLRAIRQFAFAIGDDNPLYIDSRYGRRTRWGGLIAHPTYVANLRYNMWRGALSYGTYAVTSLVAGFSWEWNDVIRLDDKFETSFIASEVIEKKGRTGPLCFTYSHAGYWNQFKELVATGRAGNCIIGKAGQEESIKKKEGIRDNLVYERGVYRYSKEEIDEIIAGIEGEERRGATPRYWEDVEVGDKLTPVVKGPLTTCDLMGYDAATCGLAVPSFELFYRSRKNAAGLGVYLNTMTGWPYDSGGAGHYDWDTAKSRGLPAPFDVGCMRAVMSSHLLSNWMGDDGFIRRVNIQFRKPNFWGDVTWLNAEVVRKYRDKVGDEEYGAVDIRITGTNQLGEVSTPGITTVYLPSHDTPVKIPVPHEDKYEEYEKYVEDCNELLTRRKTDPTWPIEGGRLAPTA
jgi:acyl dehydratase